MNETLREKEEISRLDSEALRRLRDEATALRRKVDQHAELMAEKDAREQDLHDQIFALELQIGQTEERNENLQKDNAKLLQRWLDAKQAEVNRMNEANDFYTDMRTKHQATVNGNSESGNGSANGEGTTGGTKDGTKSQPDTAVNLTPNG